MILVLVLIAVFVLPISAQWHRGPTGRLQPVSAPAIEKLAAQTLTAAKAGTPYLNSQGYFYVQPFLAQSGQALFSIRLDSQSGDVMEVGQMPTLRDSVVHPKISIKQIQDKAKQILNSHCLEVGKIYKSPRSFYLIAVKCKKGKTLAYLKSDGKEIW